MLSYDGQESHRPLKKCLKCGHQRTEADPGPEWGCPACGAVYAKVEAAMAARSAQDAGEAAQRHLREAERLERARRRGGRDVPDEADSRKGLAQLTYLLLAAPVVVGLVGALVGGAKGLAHPSGASWAPLCAVVGVVLAHALVRDETWVDTHFRWQIRAFWRLIAWGLGMFGLVYVVYEAHRWNLGGGGDTVIDLAGVGTIVAGIVYFVRVLRGWVGLNRGVDMGL